MQLTRAKKLMLNTVTALVDQAVVVLCGFILPRMFLVSYGSAVNGLQASITQFLGVIVLCEMGVGAVVQSALYKPLAQKNELAISQIVCSAERFFRKLGALLLLYTFGLMCVYPVLIKHEFGFVYTASLILIISLSSFAHYFLGITYRLLLHADQYGFIPTALRSVCLLVSTAVCVGLMKAGVGIHGVKLAAAVFFILQPVLLAWYVRKHYTINHRLKLTVEPIKQKWNGFAQHIASFVLVGTDMLVLTVFSTLDNVSVYSVYNLVANGMRQFMMALTTGIQATFGNMLANEEWEKVTVFFARVEWLMHTSVTLLFGLCGVLIVPFISVYTRGITDANYIVPLFAALLVFAQALFCMRLPYSTLIMAAGHYKETQNSAILETVLNIVLSVVLVQYWGLVGVAVGTIIAVGYRTLYFVWYLSGNILKRSRIYFVKCIGADVLVVAVLLLLCHPFTLQRTDYIAWCWLACKVSLIGVGTSWAVNRLLFPAEVKAVVGQLRRVKNLIHKRKETYEK
jgi:O-antigen/teichoic acid export membrane protein